MNTACVVEKQRAFFRAGNTLPLAFRHEALKKLYAAIKHREEDLQQALCHDLGKSSAEAFMCEIGLTLSEISYVRRHLNRWARDVRKPTPLTNFPALDRIVQEPYGVVLVMSPWNYPVLLTLEPLVGAIAAGNCAILKPSAYSPHTSDVLAQLIRETFSEEYVAVVTGGRAENSDLLEQRFDYIFFTGGVRVGKLVLEKAAKHLTPVTLELGGKSPCIIDHTADLPLAARRLAFGKWLNCGQTCIAPDYVLIEHEVHDELIRLLKEEIRKMFYSGDSLSNDYGKIINQKHFDRLSALIDRGKVVCGGGLFPQTLRIEPTVMDNVTPADAVMQEEIFGPVLPVITVDNMQEAESFVLSREKPLALYLFSNDKNVQNRFIRNLSFGGGCINDTIMHIASSRLPFGGVGNSGMGAYHGKHSFSTFSHAKPVVYKPYGLDLPLRYAPYTRLKERLMRLFLR
ncbi:MAG TPA: aldehyde dehydrogenase family protein [Bacteroidales bacterium]|nr:aldehyde dehydrogenase family protein [Bacteroidales bacterium]